MALPKSRQAAWGPRYRWPSSWKLTAPLSPPRACPTPPGSHDGGDGGADQAQRNHEPPPQTGREARAALSRAVLFLLFLSHCVCGAEHMHVPFPTSSFRQLEEASPLLRATQAIKRGVRGCLEPVSPTDGWTRPCVYPLQGSGRGGSPCAVRVCA